jgi:hypothetical protein
VRCSSTLSQEDDVNGQKTKMAKRWTLILVAALLSFVQARRLPTAAFIVPPRNVLMA